MDSILLGGSSYYGNGYDENGWSNNPSTTGRNGFHEPPEYSDNEYDIAQAEGLSYQGSVSVPYTNITSVFSTGSVQSWVPGLTGNAGIGVFETTCNNGMNGTYDIGAEFDSFNVGVSLKTDIGDISISGSGPSVYGFGGFSREGVFGGDGGGIDLGIGASGGSLTVEVRDIAGTNISVRGGFGWGYGGHVRALSGEVLVDVNIFPFAFGYRY